MKHSQLNKAVLPFLTILFAFYWLFNLPAYHWYYAPFIFFIGIFAVIALDSTKPRLLLLVSVLAVSQSATNAWWLTKLTSGECMTTQKLDSGLPRRQILTRK